MLNFIKFCKSNNKQVLFNKEYRNGYKKMWINNLRDYKP